MSLLVVARDPALRVLLGVQGLYQVLTGATDFLMVVLALSILHIGQGGAGYLNAVLGAGGLLAGVATVRLIGRSKLAGIVVIALVATNIALAALGFNTMVLLAFVLLASAFSVLESCMDIGLALGVVSVRVPFAIGGSRGAFWIPALAGVVVIVALSGRLLAVDRSAPVPHVQIELLRSISIFSCLNGPALEGVAHQLVPVTARTGTVVVGRGDRGDR